MAEQKQEQIALQQKKGTKISRIVMHGFKSFAKYTEIPLCNGFNCVLGPNGSGKSNVMDALCFVLGKSSSKSLRAEKSSNLIYNGGKSKNPAKYGEVSIFFSNDNRTFPTDEKEVKITRIVKQSGQSVYKINDKARTRQEVLDLLSVAKINPDGYNIILQGDIVKFVEMPPIERRELIEEIAGISIYEEKKHKAILELQKVEERLKETEIVLTERNTYLKELKKDRDQALKYKEMNDKVKQNKASYLKIQIDQKDKEKNDLEKKIDETTKELEKVNEKISKLRQENIEKRNKIEEITKEIEEKGEVEQVKLNKEVESLKIELTKNSSRIDTLKNEISKIIQRKKDLNAAVDDIDKKINELSNEKNNLHNRINSREKERKEISNKVVQFKQKHKLDNIGDIEKKVEEIDKKAEDLQKGIHSLREQQHELIREKDKVNHDVSVIDAQIKKVLDTEKEHKDQIESLKKERDDFKKSTLELNKRLDEDSSLAAKLFNARKKIHDANEELAKLNARQIGIREAAHTDIAVKKILELKNSKNSIYGTVAELGKVDSKYSLALEIAAGPRIKSIVVDDDKTAAELIRYLKQNKLGTATFLPLNKLNPRPTNSEVIELEKSNGCHGLAIDLVTFDPKFKKVFSYVFADTLVVDNIEVARRLGIGRAKYVTLDGDSAEVSGAMHGGFRLRKKQGMGFKEKDLVKDIEDSEQSISELKNTIDVFEKMRIENEEQISSLREKKANLEGNIIKTEKSLHLNVSDTADGKKKKEELKKDEKQIEDKISGINEKISSTNKELTDLKIEKQKLRSEISQLRNPTLLAELNTFEQKLKEFSEEIITINSEIRNIDTQINDIYANEKERTEKILKQLDKDAAEFSAELSNLQNAVKEKDKVLKEKEKLAQEFYAKFKSLFVERGKVDSEIQKNENAINVRVDESRKVEIRNNTFSLKIAEVNAMLAGLQQEFSQYEGVKLDLGKSEEELKNEIKKFEKMRESIGSVNMRALEIYEEVEKQYNSLLEKKDKLVTEKDDVLAMMKEIEGKKKDLFMGNFNVINENFKKFFSRLSVKGEAYLVLENPENPFEAGLRINVKIAGSKFLDIRSLSGGEKTLTALAFIFSIQEHEPASFYVLDEVDAALDKHNSEKLAKLIKSYSEYAQYLIISHNDGIISEADNLYGISMNEHGISQMVSLKV